MNIYNYSVEDFENYFISINEKKFKAVQLFDWLYKKRINDFDEMTNLKKDVIKKLNDDFVIEKLKIVKREEDIDVYKYLFELKDQNKIEAVLMHHNYGYSLCISSQVGCNMGCSFCESGRLGKIRNLTPAEMVLQILQIEEDLKLRISHIVIMGIGEPFDNYDNVMKFIDIINDDRGIAIGSRHITISTCGIIPKIKEFMNNPKQINLAISLHAPNQELRSKIMKIGNVYQLDELIEVVKEYIAKTNRRITFEYIMLKGINDSKQHALQLVKLIKGINCYVNLIPYNETTHLEYQKSSQTTILKFYDLLKKNKINVTIRKEFGSKVSAACGQLRANNEEG